MPAQDEPVRIYDALAGEWKTIAVPAQAVPRTARRPKPKPGKPVSWAGLSHGSPVPDMTDTAYAPMGQLADMRTYVKAPAIRTRRPPVVMPSGLATDTRYADLTQ
jgi:hypothetical protein